MTTLQHTFEGFRRVMQMSPENLFVFVEGPTDRAIYSRLADAECINRNIESRMVTAGEIRGVGGGKSRLLEFFRYLKREKSLDDRFHGKTSVSIFFLDKDIDDIQKTRLRSVHAVYTEHYDIESYYYLHGELDNAAAHASNLDIASIRKHVGDFQNWRTTKASLWKDWVKLCVASRCCPNATSSFYGRPISEINQSGFGQVDRKKYLAVLRRLKKGSGFAPKEFDMHFYRLSKAVDKRYLSGRQEAVFKGKWYTKFLAEDVKSAAGSRNFEKNGLETRIVSNLALSLNVGHPWADNFRLPIRSLLISAGL